MEITSVHKAVHVFDVGQGGRPPIATGGAPVATELAASASVQQASAGDGARNDPQRAPPEPSPSVERHLTIDTKTRQMVSQVIEQQSGEILSQVPDQALLRVKAYAREMVAAMEQAQEGRGRQA